MRMQNLKFSTATIAPLLKQQFIARVVKPLVVREPW